MFITRNPIGSPSLGAVAPYVGVDPSNPAEPAGVGVALAAVIRQIEQYREHASILAAGRAESTQDRFHQLAERWKGDSVFQSSIEKMSMHPAYQQIIGLGQQAIPLILSELREAPDHWYWALNAISGEDPVPENDRGDIYKMRDAWLSWADRKGYRK